MCQNLNDFFAVNELGFQRVRNQSWDFDSRRSQSFFGVLEIAVLQLDKEIFVLGQLLFNLAIQFSRIGLHALHEANVLESIGGDFFVLAHTRTIRDHLE